MRNRFVKVRFVSPPDPIEPDRPYYKPVELRNGNLYALCKPEDTPSIYGFLTPEDAQAVITKIEERESSVR